MLTKFEPRRSMSGYGYDYGYKYGRDEGKRGIAGLVG